MKFSIVLVGFVPKTLNEIQLGLIDKFKKMKSESQCITDNKDIKQLLIEFVWEFDQIFKTFGQSEFPNVGCATQGMVHCHLVATHLNVVDATKTHVLDRGSGDSHKVRSLSS